VDNGRLNTEKPVDGVLPLCIQRTAGKRYSRKPGVPEGRESSLLTPGVAQTKEHYERAPIGE
jgi:hypothetical protein